MYEKTTTLVINPIIEVHKYSINRLNEMISKNIDEESRLKNNMYETYGSYDKFGRPELKLSTHTLSVKTVKLKKNTYISDFTFTSKENAIVRGFIINDKFTTTTTLNDETKNALIKEFNNIYAIIMYQKGEKKSEIN